MTETIVKTISPFQVYRLNPAIAIENFGERFLALHCEDLRMIELNATAGDLITKLDGQANLHQIASVLAKDYNQSIATVLTDLQAIMTQMLKLGVVECITCTKEKSSQPNRLNDQQIEGVAMTKGIPRYVADPVVSCREEGKDGALLFNPDTDEVLVVNITGLLIWRALADRLSQKEIVEKLLQQCDNVPPDQVTQDVNEFLEQLVAKSFVDTLEGDAP